MCCGDASPTLLKQWSKPEIDYIIGSYFSLYAITNGQKADRPAIATEDPFISTTCCFDDRTEGLA
jgi:hypothetical protein